MSKQPLPWNTGNQMPGGLNDAIEKAGTVVANKRLLTRSEAEGLFPLPNDGQQGIATRCTEMADRIILAMDGFDGDQSSEFLDEVFSKLLPDVHDLLTLLAAASAPPEPTPAVMVEVVRALYGEGFLDGQEAQRKAEATPHPDTADAERYRWLRDEADYMRVPEGSPQVVLTDEWGNIVSIQSRAYPRGKTLDAAIDAARGIGASTGGGNG